MDVLQHGAEEMQQHLEAYLKTYNRKASALRKGHGGPHTLPRFLKNVKKTEKASKGGPTKKAD